jgi:hypothetical protein
MVEFTGVHGTFTILQVNTAEMVGAGMLTAVMDLHRAGRISAERVREIIKPYHIRQIESDAIDSKSLHSLTPFCRGVSVLPRAAVTGRIYFSVEAVRQAREAKTAENAILVKERFTPPDVIDMQKVSGICSLSPAAIHVVTSPESGHPGSGQPQRGLGPPGRGKTDPHQSRQAGRPRRGLGFHLEPPPDPLTGRAFSP